MKEYIHEQAKEIEVFDHCDVLVVGAGPAGTAAALWAHAPLWNWPAPVWANFCSSMTTF